jgi:hypothetical protein
MLVAVSPSARLRRAALVACPLARQDLLSAPHALPAHRCTAQQCQGALRLARSQQALTVRALRIPQVQLLGQPISVGRPSGYVDPSAAQQAAAVAAAALEQFKVRLSTAACICPSCVLPVKQHLQQHIVLAAFSERQLLRGHACRRQSLPLLSAIDASPVKDRVLPSAVL